MELEPGSGPAEELRQVQIARRRKRVGRLEPRGWQQEWLEAWPRAKTAMMMAEREVQQFGLPWAEAWTRAEAQAWGEAKAWVNVQYKSKAWDGAREDAKWAEAEALSLAGVWGWLRGKAQARGNCVPDGLLADPVAITEILTSLNRFGIAQHFWNSLPETRNEYSCITQFFTPIAWLPIELLHQIFLAIEETRGSQLVLMLVCKHWNAVVASIWGSLSLGIKTPINVVKSKLEMNQWLLDVVVDTDSDRDYFTPAPIRPRAPWRSLVVEPFPARDGSFEAIFAAIEATSRWRSLVVKSFTVSADLPEVFVNRHLQRHSNATMSRFTTLRIESSCKTSPLLNGLLRILGTTAGPALTTVEINSLNVILFLTPTYSSIFHSVKVLSLDAPGIHNPVDLLPHLHQLETFTVPHLSFPAYPNHVELPFVHTLRHLTLRAASIQWMSDRTFHTLEFCTLIFPLHRHVLHTFRTTLPNCNHLTFQGYPLKILGGVSANTLSRLSVTCSGSFNRRGSRQLVWFSGCVLGEPRLAPKILHISIQATNRAWMTSLVSMSNLEELVIYSAQPSSLGAKVCQSLVVHPVNTGNAGVTSTPGQLGAPICPSLRRFGLNYDRWLRPSEEFDLVPVFVSIIQSRRQSKCSLQSFNLRIMGDRVELIEGSEMSDKGFNHLHRKIKGYSGNNSYGGYCERETLYLELRVRPLKYHGVTDR